MVQEALGRMLSYPTSHSIPSKILAQRYYHHPTSETGDRLREAKQLIQGDMELGFKEGLCEPDVLLSDATFTCGIRTRLGDSHVSMVRELWVLNVAQPGGERGQEAKPPPAPPFSKQAKHQCQG